MFHLKHFLALKSIFLGYYWWKRGFIIIISWILQFQLTQVWKTLTPIYPDSIALKKNSTYTIFFKKAIVNIVQNGVLDLYNKRNLIDDRNCVLPIQKVNPLGFRKTASIFTILLLGSVFSVSIFFYECFKKPKKNATVILPEGIRIKQLIIKTTGSLSEETWQLLKKEIFLTVEKFQKRDVMFKKLGKKPRKTKNIHSYSKIQRSIQEYISVQEL